MNQKRTSETVLVALQQCLQQVADDRDRNAFATLFDHYCPLIRAYSLAREPGADLLADELAQDVMVKVWEKAHTYKPDRANINTWIYTMARNCRIDRLRRQGRYASEIDPTLIFDTLEDEAPGPFQNAQQQRLTRSLKGGIEQLPPEQAEVLQKVYMEGKSHQEASEELRLPLGTLKSRVRLALQKLQLLVRR